MVSEGRAVLILTLEGQKDIPLVEKRISQIGGVSAVEYSHMTHKLLVRYGGEVERMRKIEIEVKKALRDQKKNNRG